MCEQNSGAGFLFYFLSVFCVKWRFRCSHCPSLSRFSFTVSTAILFFYQRRLSHFLKGEHSFYFPTTPPNFIRSSAQNLTWSPWAGRVAWLELLLTGSLSWGCWLSTWRRRQSDWSWQPLAIESSSGSLCLQVDRQGPCRPGQCALWTLVPPLGVS